MSCSISTCPFLHFCHRICGVACGMFDHRDYQFLYVTFETRRSKPAFTNFQKLNSHRYWTTEQRRDAQNCISSICIWSYRAYWQRGLQIVKLLSSRTIYISCPNPEIWKVQPGLSHASQNMRDMLVLVALMSIINVTSEDAFSTTIRPDILVVMLYSGCWLAWFPFATVPGAAPILMTPTDFRLISCYLLFGTVLVRPYQGGRLPGHFPVYKSLAFAESPNIVYAALGLNDFCQHWILTIPAISWITTLPKSISPSNTNTPNN